MQCMEWWSPRALVFATTNELKKRLFAASYRQTLMDADEDALVDLAPLDTFPPRWERYFTYEAHIRGVGSGQEIQQCIEMVVKMKADQARQEVGFTEQQDILVEDSGLFIPALGGLPGPMTKQFVKRGRDGCLADFVQQRCTEEGLPVRHTSVIYWDRGHHHAATMIRVDLNGRLLALPEGSPKAVAKHGFDVFFQPDGWTRRYRECRAGGGDFESLVDSCAARSKNGCAITRSCERFLLLTTARRLLEDRLVSRGQFGDVALLHDAIAAHAQSLHARSTRCEHLVAEDVNWVVEDVLRSGVGVGRHGYRQSPLALAAVQELHASGNRARL